MCSVKIILLKLAKLNSAAIFIQLLHEKENTAEEFCVCVCVYVCVFIFYSGIRMLTSLHPVLLSAYCHYNFKC